MNKNKFCLSFLIGFWKTQLDKINDSSVLCENSGIPCVSRVLQFYEKERLKEVLIMWILISYHPLWGSKCIINGAHLRLLSFQQKYCLSACSIYRIASPTVWLQSWYSVFSPETCGPRPVKKWVVNIEFHCHGFRNIYNRLRQWCTGHWAAALVGCWTVKKKKKIHNISTGPVCLLTSPLCVPVIGGAHESMLGVFWDWAQSKPC